MPCILTVDIGNTTTRFGLVALANTPRTSHAAEAEPATPSNTTSSVEVLGTCAITTRQPLTADEASILTEQALGRLHTRCGGERVRQPSESQCRPEIDGADGVILSCVVPTLTAVWRQALSSTCGVRTLVVGPGLRSGIKLRFNDPSEVGPDRIADAVAARALYGSPAIVVDMGTTTNFEAIDVTGAFCGGIIAPGISIGAQALTAAAARLPMIEVKAPERVLGRTTREAMQSGVVLGEAARIDGLIDAIEAELARQAAQRAPKQRDGQDAAAADEPKHPVIVMTGQHAAAMAPLIRHAATVDDTLTLAGLALIWQANQR